MDVSRIDATYRDLLENLLYDGYEVDRAQDMAAKGCACFYNMSLLTVRQMLGLARRASIRPGRSVTLSARPSLHQTHSYRKDQAPLQ